MAANKAGLTTHNGRGKSTSNAYHTNRSADSSFAGTNRKGRTKSKSKRAGTQGTYPEASPLPLGAVLPHQLVGLLNPPVAVDHHLLLLAFTLRRLLLAVNLGRLLLRLRRGGGGRGHQPHHDRREAGVAGREQGPRRSQRWRGRRSGEEARCRMAEEDGSGHPGAHRRWWWSPPICLSRIKIWNELERWGHTVSDGGEQKLLAMDDKEAEAQVQPCFREEVKEEEQGSGGKTITSVD
ncbi:hypothetical protein EJB05_39441, partial [Eragrostis curvula]